ncbi:SHOCT domain-containing protein [halophilic archaeon]|nr:SHOCT domain-containing protein [halophilic archaeon]
MDDALASLLEEAPAITVFLVLGIGLVALFTGQPWWWMVFPVGFAVVLPLVAILSDTFAPDADAADEGDSEERDDTQDALDALRSRYARGEIDEAEFERRVERLLENETVDDASARRERETGRE